MLTYTTDNGQKVRWSVERCRDSHNFFTQENRPQPVTEAIMKCSISLGITKITKKTATEFFRRCKIHEYLNGPIMWKEGEPVSVSLQLINQFIGAYHNGPPITDAKFRILIEGWVVRNVNKNITVEAPKSPQKEPVEA